MIQTRLIAAATALTALFLAGPAYAQFDSFGANVAISLSPRYPQPGQSVHLTLNGSGVDLTSSSVVWQADGKIIAQGVGKDSADIVAGKLGSETAVEADVVGSDGQTYSTLVTVAPTQLDLLVGSDSYTPPFYRGRALPSPGTNLIVQALAHFKRADGSLIADGDIVYTWKQDGQVLGTLSGRGKSSARIPIQHLFTGSTLTLDAASVDGTRSGETSVSVPQQSPALELYEDHPLYGILYNNALNTTVAVPENEATFAAVPYFAQAASTDDPALSYVWSVNDARVPRATGSQSELTINADNSTGMASISLELTRAGNFYLDALGKWNVSFSTSQTGGANPFTQPTP